ncbi:MAG: PfkB family carbohydrate kinase, partial [Spirochaetaceae bacterium]|jgi:fructokinase|nr:PfkB family carbohydrate kinase [Spirochaetaceae bacterium]
MLVRRLSENAVGTDWIIRSGENSTLAFVKLEPGKEPAYVFYTQGSADSSLRPGDLPQKLAPEIRCILFGSIAMTMEPIATAIETLVFRENRLSDSSPRSGELPESRLVISLDPNIRPFMIRDREAYVKRFEGWVQASTIAKISKADFDFIYPGLGLEKSLKKILTMGPCMALTTLGNEGARALLRKDDGTILDVSAPVVDLPVADTIGAGDTFHGAFLSWLERAGKMSRDGILSLTEKELYEVLFFANKAASLVCSRHGADPPSRAEVEALSPRTQVLGN